MTFMLDEYVDRARRSTRQRVARLIAGVVIASTVLVSGSSGADAQIGCSQVEIVTARGTWEPQNAAFLLPQVANRVRTGLTGVSTSVYDVVYPAQPSFATSAPQGVTNLISHVNAETQQCPNQKYILLGYSQGGLVTSDSLVSTGRAYGGTGTLSSAAAANIVAIGNFGSMRFTAGQSYNKGTPEAGKQSLLPVQPGALSAYADKFIDYCYNDDWVCQGDGTFLHHLWYIFDTGNTVSASTGSQKVVADFVVAEFRAN
jgi:pimeloyl-ACP methyl ester carboxylesterase